MQTGLNLYRTMKGNEFNYMKKQGNVLTTKKIGREGGKNFLLEKYYCLHSFLQLHRQIYTSLTNPKPIALFIN